MEENESRVFPADSGPDCSPLDGRFPWMRSQNDLYRALLCCWSADTCAPRLRSRWTPDNPTLGQCSTTAFLAQELFGGDVYGIPQEDGGVHCFNRVGGVSFDLTSEQFLPDSPDYSGASLQSREERFSDPERRERYEILRNRLLSFDRIAQLKGEHPLNAIVVYYSLSGNSAYVAHRIARLIGAKELALNPEVPYPSGGFRKFFFGGKSAVTKEAPALLPYSVDWDAVDTVILGTPVWAGTFVPPLRTFLREQGAFLADKRVAAFACSSGGSAEKALERLRAEASVGSFLETLSLVDPKDRPSGEKEQALFSFCEKISASPVSELSRRWE
ncbi:MAG: hypothetical protein J5938_04375 [Clostridia bacterium]|nr:hypothetical protein [Clostridia bacterium]